ncbi:MAG: integrase core domain-containing protein [Turicibacter sp.]|nr:integrase core domain-containing protein [Turicibacter sp.]
MPKECQNLKELKRKIKRYIMYHNTARYQRNLKKMTPVGFRNHLLNVV